MKSTTLWKMLLFLWIYSGILRNVFPKLNYILYILPFIIPFFYFMFVPSRVKTSEKIRIGFYSFLLIISIFQTLHYFNKSIELKILFTGLILYGLAPTIIFFGLNAEPDELLKPFITTINFAIPINLVVAFLQVIGNLEFFRYSPLTGGEAMTTNGSVLRAFGTFTHPTGFATFLSVASVVAIYQFRKVSNLMRYSHLFQLVILYLLSGSRTVFINLILVLLTFVFLKRKTFIDYTRSGNFISFIGIISTIGLTFLALKLKYSWVLESFASRISTAAAQENSLSRIFNQSFGWIGHLGDSLWGHGLGSFATISIGFAKDRSLWIEDDLLRIIAEAGTIMGIAIIALRWALPLVIHFRVRKSKAEERVLIYLLLAACFSNLVVGSLTGQGSVALQVWICTSICINLTSRNGKNPKN